MCIFLLNQNQRSPVNDVPFTHRFFNSGSRCVSDIDSFDNAVRLGEEIFLFSVLAATVPRYFQFGATLALALSPLLFLLFVTTRLLDSEKLELPSQKNMLDRATDNKVL